MWFTRAFRWNPIATRIISAFAVVASTSLVAVSSASSSRGPSRPEREKYRWWNHDSFHPGHSKVVQCEGRSSSTTTGSSTAHDNSNDQMNDRIRKRHTVNKANSRTLQRTNTRDELSKLRRMQDQMLLRWERDEDGWRELPARAWPEYQPNPEHELKGIQVEAATHGCYGQQENHHPTETCQTLLFQIATSMVFYNVDPEAGFEQYKRLAQHGHVDSMVALGVILVEGLGGIRHEKEGLRWLQKAVSLDSTQALYELGTAYYTGIDHVLQDDSKQAYKMFEKAAAKGHVGAMYMMADCLIEGEGTEKNVAEAVPILYLAADQGHRYARQRIRELLNEKEYQNIE